MKDKTKFKELANSILEQVPYGIISYTAVRNSENQIIDFECLFVNPMGEKMIDIPAEKVIGKRMLKLMPSHAETGLFDKYCQLVESGKSINFKKLYEHGHLNNWFEIHASVLGDGFTASFVDISEHRKALDEIKAANSRYQQLFNESIDPIFITNNELLFLEANKSMLQAFGYSMEGLRSLNFKDLFDQENDFIRFNKEFYKNDKVLEFEAELVLKSGKLGVFLINLAEFGQKEEGITLYQGIVKDITRKKQAERELVWAEKLSMTGKLARNIAHEVRNPLTNVSLALEQLKEEIPKDIPQASLYTDIIERNAERISKLITQLLESSKPKSLKLTKSSLNDVVQNAVLFVRDRLKLEKMDLIESYEDSFPKIPLDTKLITTALINLLVNAIEAMREEEGILKIRTYRDGDKLLVDIEDNGIGIPKENMNQLFEPFFTAKKGGTGLGLMMVQNIIKSHTGEISAISEQGEGSLFRITFFID